MNYEDINAAILSLDITKLSVNKDDSNKHDSYPTYFYEQSWHPDFSSSWKISFEIANSSYVKIHASNRETSSSCGEVYEYRKSDIYLDVFSSKNNLNTDTCIELFRRIIKMIEA